MKEQTDELFFVQVKEPNEVRRNILETLKGIVEVLQRFEKFKRIRHEKLENIHKLRTLLKDANKMLGNLKAKLPQTNLRATIARGIPRQTKKIDHNKSKKGKIPKGSGKEPKKEVTELEKLGAELNAIENKLKGLT